MLLYTRIHSTGLSSIKFIHTQLAHTIRLNKSTNARMEHALILSEKSILFVLILVKTEIHQECEFEPARVHTHTQLQKFFTIKKSLISQLFL